MNKYYEIKVTIRESHPITWRRLRIPSGITFNDLAAIIETAFGWTGFHLYEFEVGATSRKMGQFIGVPPLEDEYGLEETRGKMLDSGKTKIDKYFQMYKKIKFTYDFGDNWVHDIVIEKEVNEKLEYPLCIKAKSGGYPEDCGGTYGYEEYYPNDDGREEFDIDDINDDLETYKIFAKEIYEREMF